MDINRDGGPDGPAVHTAQWYTAGWDASVTLAGLAVLMLGPLLAIVLVVGCWATLYVHARRARPVHGGS